MENFKIATNNEMYAQDLVATKSTDSNKFVWVFEKHLISKKMTWVPYLDARETKKDTDTHIFVVDGITYFEKFKKVNEVYSFIHYISKITGIVFEELK